MALPQRFDGDLRDLQDIISYLYCDYELHYLGIGYWRFRLKSGAVINFWPSTQTINFQGPPKEAKALQKKFMSIMAQR